MKAVVSWAGLAESAAQALRLGSDLAERGRVEEAVAQFRVAEEMARAARYWIEDRAMFGRAYEAMRTLGRGG